MPELEGSNFGSRRDEHSTTKALAVSTPAESLLKAGIIFESDEDDDVAQDTLPSKDEGLRFDAEGDGELSGDDSGDDSGDEGDDSGDEGSYRETWRPVTMDRATND